MTVCTPDSGRLLMQNWQRREASVIATNSPQLGVSRGEGGGQGTEQTCKGAFTAGRGRGQEEQAAADQPASQKPHVLTANYSA